jgi:predicted nuclease of predicted toxin-antitoxin system
MRFKLDENLPVEVAADLRDAGYEADSVRGEGIAGAPDSVVIERARSEGRILLTLDKGIADLREYPPERHAGIVLFRPSTSGRGAVLAFVRRHLPAVLTLDLAGRLHIVTEGAIRRR